MCIKEKGYDLHLITEKISQFTDWAFKTVTVYPSLNHLYDSIKLFPDADLFHVHNEPSFFVTTVKETFPDKPVILDVHDTMLSRRIKGEELSTRQFRISVDERNNFKLADGMVYVCEPHQAMVNEEYEITVPNIVLYSAVPLGFYRIDFKKWWGGIVYEGRIDVPGALDEGEEWDFFEYANYTHMAKEAKEQGVAFHIYTPRKNEKLREIYNPLAIMHEPLSFDRLIKEIGAHDWGVVGNTKAHPQWAIAMPNKMFEHIGACLPTVSFNAAECDKFLEETGFGISCKTIPELKERWDEQFKCRENIIKKRNKYCMEEYIGGLDNLYRNFI